MFDGRRGGRGGRRSGRLIVPDGADNRGQQPDVGGRRLARGDAGRTTGPARRFGIHIEYLGIPIREYPLSTYADFPAFLTPSPLLYAFHATY